MQFSNRVSITLLICLSVCCSNKIQHTDANGQSIHFEVNTSKQFQVIENFGASDAWACQFAGLWPDEKKNAMADLLFSTDTLNDGSPKGIGLTLWRFNIGAGSAQQGESSGIKDEWRRAESFLELDGNYNWNRQAGQVWFLKAAQKRGVQQFLGFLNSPPVTLSRNHKAYATNAITNIDSSRYHALAEYMVTVMKGLKQKAGIDLNFISPVNEPQNDWSEGNQEGSPYTNHAIFGVVNALDKALEQNSMQTKIILPESYEIRYLLAEEDKPGRGNQVNTFFDPASPLYLGQVTNLSKTVAGHSYLSTSPEDAAVSVRKKLAKSIEAKPGIRYWQSEYCILGDNNGEMKGEGRDLGMNAAIYLAKVIHNDLAYANACAWQWWLAISPYDYKDGLIYIDKNKSDGNLYPSKMLWSLGNFSRFIRPGMIRVAVPGADSLADIAVSAYIENNTRKLVVVAINSSADTNVISLANSAGKPAVPHAGAEMFVTSAIKNLQRIPLSSALITLEPRSISTIVSMY